MTLGTMTAISLFSGAGGMDVGFRNAGFDIVLANEKDKHAAATYRRNFGDHISHDDIYNELDSLDRFAGVSCVFGGPPCQGFSVAGKMDLKDERSQLVNVFMEAVKITRPSMFVMENVKGLAVLKKFSDFRRDLFLAARELGYETDLEVVNAADFGVPQARERMFFVGVRGAAPFRLADFLTELRRPRVSTREAIAHLGPQGTAMNPQTCNARVTLAANPVLRKSPYAGMLFNGLGRPLNPDSPCTTLPASMGGNKTPIIDEQQFYGSGESWIEWYHARLRDGEQPLDWESTPESIRRLTISEAHVLHTFPEGFEFEGPKTSVYRQIGNAVPCGLAEAIAKATLEVASRGDETAPNKEQMDMELWRQHKGEDENVPSTDRLKTSPLLPS